MDELLDLPHPLLDEEQHPDDLEAPARRARAGPDEAREHEQHREHARPRGVAARREAGGGPEGDGLEGSEPERVERVVEGARGVQVRARGRDHRGEEVGIGPKLRVLQVRGGAARPPGDEVQREVDSRQRHEHHRHPFDGRALEVPEARVVGREPSDRDRREAVRDGVEPVHARRPVADRAEDRQPEVDVPEGLGGLGDPGGEPLVLHWPGGLRPVELEPPDPEHRQDGDREHDDPHAAQPLEHLAVKEQRPGQRVDPGDDRRAGGGEPRNRFEHRVGHRHLGVVEEQERDCAREAEDHPERDDDEEAVAEPEIAAVLSDRKPQRDPAPEDQRQGDREGGDIAVHVEPGDRERRHHGQAEQPEEEPEDALDGEQVHARGGGLRTGRRSGGRTGGRRGRRRLAAAVGRSRGVRRHRA